MGGVGIDLDLGVWDRGRQDAAIGDRREPVLGAITDQDAGVEVSDLATTAYSQTTCT
jgi:hypothetical protein